MDMMQPAEWFYNILTKTEEEILRMIKKNRELITMPIKFSCEMMYNNVMHNACNCGVALEMLKSETPPAEKMISELTGYIENGHCTHIPLIEVKTGELKTKKEEATTFLMHLSAALGKRKVLKYIFSKLTFSSSEFWNSVHEKYTTKILLLSPLHLAVIHNDIGIFELIIKKCKYLLKLRSYYFQTFPNSDIHYGNVLTFTAENNAVSFLQVVLHCHSNTYSNTEFCESFCKALETKSYECAEILAKEIRKFWFQVRNHMDTADIVFKQDDERLFNIFTSLKSLDLSLCLQRLIYHGKINYVEMILKKGKKLRAEIPFLIQAVLHKQSSEMINLVMENFAEDCRRCYKGYSALDWARVLGYTEQERLIRSYGIGTNINCVKSYPPLLAVFDFEQIGVNLLGYVINLISGGQDVNAESDAGITPFVRAMEVKGDIRYPIIRALLLNDSDPFKGIACSNYPDYLKSCFIRELLFCNIDICKQNFELSVFRRLLRDIHRDHDLGLILKYAHTIPQGYKKELTCLYESPRVGEDLIHIVDDLLLNPKSLLVICRNSIRCHYGPKIHVVARSYSLPAKLKKILTLEDDLNVDEESIVDSIGHYTVN